MDGGFVDLRQATDNGSGSDSFWPSFTDIMMVVVMIFMIASTALMLRNWELVEELRATIIAEMQAEELARSMTETSATLEEQLAQAQHANSELRIQRMRSNERIAELEVRLAARDQRVMELETDNQQLAASLQKYRRDAMLDADQLKQTQDELATLQQRLDEVLVELSEGEEARQQQSVELATLRLGSSLTEQQLLNLQMEYSELQVKYDKLFKPARSAKGKHVVTVRYRKEAGAYELHLRENEEADYTEVSREELHRRMSALKDKYGNLLYVKLIIPDDSGLSYNEAWSFTVEMLDKYDYYHQN
jgi:chromosome segregation ATPase